MERGLIGGDCLQVLPELDADSVDLICFSPPYDAIRDYNKYPPIDRIKLGKELYRVTKDGGVAVVVIQDQTKNAAKSLTSFRWAVDWVDECGWRLFETCIYSRHGVPGNYWTRRFRVDHEYVHIFVKGQKPAYFNKEHLKVTCKHAGVNDKMSTRRCKDGSTVKCKPFLIADKKCRGTIWQYSTSNTEGNKVKKAHPATYPDKLASDVIRCFCPQDGLVLDPMMGSGTTCVEAAKIGRNFIGIDISEEYVAIARQRLEHEGGGISVL